MKFKVGDLIIYDDSDKPIYDKPYYFIFEVLVVNWDSLRVKILVEYTKFYGTNGITNLGMDCTFIKYSRFITDMEKVLYLWGVVVKIYYLVGFIMFLLLLELIHKVYFIYWLFS